MGDVFLIPLDETSAAGGQVVSIRKGAELYLAIFGLRLNLKEVDPTFAVNSLPLLLTLSLDAKIWHGNWPIIGNLIKKVKHYPQPNYKVEYAGVMSIESRDHAMRRVASPEELKVLNYRTVTAPITVEKAIKAHFGIGPWIEYYDGLLAEHAIASAKMM